ncbi:TPA: hypothetical protein SMI07_000700 [Serratia liquefaciens]|nr:hypothetical protein [Serratia liquefaciens]
MDKLREEFEQWFSPREKAMKSQGLGLISISRLKSRLWEAWQASRACIVVDTPPLCGDGENDTEYTEGYNDGITATEKTIMAIGLSIKGE